MFKRIITLALAIVCLASFAIVGVSALEADENGEVVYFIDLVTPNMIEDVQGYITYDATVLESLDYDAANLGDSAIVNMDEVGKVYFNASVVKGIDFTGDSYKNVIEVKFNVIDEDVDYEALPEMITEDVISFTIEEMTEKDGDSYFTDSQQVNEDVEIGWGFYAWAPDTEPTTEATVPTTTEAKPVETTAVAPETDVQGTTGAESENPDVVPTGANVAIFAVLAVVAMAGVAVVVLRKKTNA